MKQIENNKSNNLFKKLFIKLCRILGFEIIDQSNFTVPTQKADLSNTLSIAGKKSITIPLGEIKIEKKIDSVLIILRTCTSELIMDQNKQRLFGKNKKDYTVRCLNSILKSMEHAKKYFNNVEFKLLITDTNSNESDIENMKNIIKKYNFKSKCESVDLNFFKKKLEGNYSDAKSANMANFYNSLIIAKNCDSDLIYFVEDDYIHSLETIKEMLFSYEKFNTFFKNDLVLLPSDYPYLYMKDHNTKIYLGEKKHWRLVNESLVTFLTSKNLVLENFSKLERMGKEWIDPWEKPLHEIYRKNPCLSPIPSLAIHCANINSVFGVSPNINWMQLWKESEN